MFAGCPRMKTSGPLGEASSCETCRRRKQSCANIRHSNLKIGLLLHSAAPRTRGKLVTWASMVGSIRSAPCPSGRGSVVGEMDFMDEWFPIQVKQKDKVGRPDIDAFEAVMIREERRLGYFVGFDFTGDALFEIDRFRRKEGREIKPLTVGDILGEEISRKLD